MLNKLDKLSVPAEDDEHAIPDISLLSPEDQDWVHDMFGKVRESTITESEVRELCDVLNRLPVLGPDEKFQGPRLDIPRSLEHHFQLFTWHERGRCHWPRFDFHNLKAVQKVRLVELCRRYGWEGEYPMPRSAGMMFFKRGNAAHLLPLSEWDPEDEAEMRSLLDEAAARRTQTHE